MSRQVEAEPSSETQRFATAVRRENASRWSFDRRIPLFSFWMMVLSSTGTLIGGVYIIGEMRQSFSQSLDKLAAHDIRLAKLEDGLIETNLKAAEANGTLKQILLVLQSDHVWRTERGQP